MRDLILVNILIILMDISLLGTQFAGHYEIETTYKSAAYSIKLKLEFIILNQLMAISRGKMDSYYNQDSMFNHKRSFGPFTKNFSVIVGKGNPSSDMSGQDKDCVLKTTDVDVMVLGESPTTVDQNRIVGSRFHSP